MDLCEFEASLGYRVNFKTAKVVLSQKEKKKEMKKEEKEGASLVWFIMVEQRAAAEGGSCSQSVCSRQQAVDSRREMRQGHKTILP